MNITITKKLYFFIIQLILVFTMLLIMPQISNAESKPEAAINYRKALMTNIQHNLRTLSDILKGNLDQQNHLKDITLIMNLNAKQAVDAYKFDTRGDKDQKARADIWKKPDDFSAQIQAFIRETTTLNELAVKGDIQAMKAQLGVIGKNCASCHKQFRMK